MSHKNYRRQHRKQFSRRGSSSKPHVDEKLMMDFLNIQAKLTHTSNETDSKKD